MKNILNILFLSVILLLRCTEKKNTDISKENKKDTTILKIPAKTLELQSGNLTLQVDREKGARISCLKIAGEEILYINRDSNNNWGSTLWPSPQASWGWPPIAVLDSEPYEDVDAGQGFSLVSKVADKPKISFLKNFTASPSDTSFIINYTIKNESDSSLNVAPWEITRVPSGGLIFFPAGNDAPTGDLKKLIKQQHEITWFDYDSSAIAGEVPKLFADGAEGWIAYTNNNGILFIKKFNDTPLKDKAPDPENEIELFTDPSKRYTEVEQQGPYTSIDAKKSFTWKTQWYVRKLPKEIRNTIGSKGLADFVRATIK